MTSLLADISSPLLATTGGPLTINRRAAGAYVNGTWVPGSVTAIPIIAHVHTASGEELLKLPEGERTEATLVVYTASPLVISEVGAQTEGDRFMWRGAEYRVRLVEDWAAQGNYGLALCVKVSA